MAGDSKYKEFGKRLANWRTNAGFAQQSDLATKLKTTQQTVSRWELGDSRPRQNQIPLIAKTLRISADQLLEAAGYTTKPSPVVVSFDQLFPIDSLSAESFERFCLYFLSEIYPGARIHRAGSQGHKQQGLDVEIELENKKRLTFQCKRVDEFGPSKVLAAIGAHTREADEKYLLLSRIASPKARQALDDHPDWNLWDKEDITRILRKLPREQQIRLVDMFFPGQRLALLGETEYGPWQKTEEFFAPFQDAAGAFSHAWHLVGRTSESSTLSQALAKHDVNVVFLFGAGGTGKSRLLKETIEKYEKLNPTHVVRFLSPSQELTIRSLQELGTSPKLLIVDDAHDRLDLEPLFQFASNLSNLTKLLISSRPYGASHLKNQAAAYSISNERTATIDLAPIAIEQSETLALEVLQHFSGPTKLAKQIARLTRDCTLATVIASHVVAKDGAHFNRLSNEEVFRSTLMSRFQHVIAGNVGSKADADSIRRLMRVIALTQPFSPADESFSALVQAVEGITIPETNRLVRNLSVGGVLFKRGRKYRLSPDMLADFIIEDACIAGDGQSTGYAEKVFAHSNLHQAKNLLLNMGKVDWRMSNGNPNDSNLLAYLWNEIGASGRYIDAVTEVAYFQPRRSLDYAERLIREGREIRKLSKLIRNAGYDLNHLPRACQLLWEIGKDDSRKLNQYPDHPIRILNELCEPERSKPVEHNKVLVDYSIFLLSQEDSWGHAYTPFDILKGILETEGDDLYAEGRHTVFERFLINPNFVKTERLRAIEAAIEILIGPNKQRAILAADFLGNAFRFPVHAIDDELRQEWTKQFVSAFEKILEAISSVPLDPLVYLELLQAVHGLTKRPEKKLANLVKRFVDLQATSIEFRLIRALVDSWGDLFERRDYKRWQVDVANWNDSLSQDLLKQFPNPKALWLFIDTQLAAIKQICPDKLQTGMTFIAKLIEHAECAFAEEILEKSLADDSSARLYAGIALAKLFKEHHPRARQLAQRLLKSDNPQNQVAVARSFMWSGALRFENAEQDLQTFRELLGGNNDWVVDNGISTLYTAGPTDPLAIIELCKCVDMKRSADLADATLGLLCHHKLNECLGDEDILFFMDQLKDLPKVEGHWTQTFLADMSYTHPELTADFFFHRVEKAADSGDWYFSPFNHHAYEQVPLRFMKSGKSSILLVRFVNWVVHRDDSLFRYRAEQLFEIMFCPLNDEVLSFLESWITRASETEVKLIAKFCSSDARRIIFEHSHILKALLQRAKQYGRESEENAISQLYGGAITGVKSAAFGEAFQEDVEMKAKCDTLLQTISKFAPEYRLIELLRKNSEREILTSVREVDDIED